MTPGQINNADGFTLIEAMIALLVLAAGLSGVAKITEISYRHLSATANYTEAAMLADSHFVSLAATPGLTADILTGRYNERFSWRLSLTEATGSNAAGAPLPATIANLPVNHAALRADLLVMSETDSRSVRFHTLIMVSEDAP